MELRSENECWSIPAPDMEPSSLTAEGMLELEADFSGGKIVKYIRDVEFACVDGVSLKLQLLLPSMASEEEKRPLILFIRGSAWQKQSVVPGIPQLVEIARRGFLVASVEYRPAPGYHFPVQSDDGWRALEFLLEHADELGWDTGKLAAWGSSSGAHTALLMAMMPEYRKRQLRIGAVVDYYGPAWLPAMIDYHGTSTKHLDELLGVPVKEHLELAEKASPVSYLDGDVPAVLLMHGDKDKSCSFEQSVILYRKMREAGKDAVMYRMHNAAHGGSPFWTPAVMDIVEAFLRDRLNWKKV
ncbi:alpha/beta hydrolase fold domain-containing protein [Candidatus Merdisoma sp. HCP28S3_D10]|uniref:alpha/beta hydrolase fold domain-containing protein n=1 Tax=unclassified Candidatus Merdisoma TaxID=3099611 RepID=UPI003F8A34A2